MASDLSPVLAFGAGGLTILSPCVLPLVPIVLSSAARHSRFGPLALAAGLVASFTIAGFLLATLGAAADFDSEIVRLIGGLILLLAGLVLLLPRLQSALARLTTPLAAWAGRRQSGLEARGLWGQAAIGALLGLVWSPCVGPTLGAATVLAAQGEDLGAVALVMLCFGLGIAAILLFIALATRSLLSRWRGRMMATGDRGRRILGAIITVVALLLVSGLDRMIEGVLVQASPVWLTDLTTAI